MNDYTILAYLFETGEKVLGFQGTLPTGSVVSSTWYFHFLHVGSSHQKQLKTIIAKRKRYFIDRCIIAAATFPDDGPSKDRLRSIQPSLLTNTTLWTEALNKVNDCMVDLGKVLTKAENVSLDFVLEKVGVCMCGKNKIFHLLQYNNCII